MNQTHRKHFRLVEEFTHGTLLIQSAPADGDWDTIPYEWDSPQETLRTLLSELNDVHQELASIDRQASLRIVEGLRADLQGACIERDQLRADLTAAKDALAASQDNPSALALARGTAQRNKDLEDIVQGLRAELADVRTERIQFQSELINAKNALATVGRELNHRGERIEELQKALVAQGKELTAAKDAHALAVTAYNRLDAAYSALMNGK